MTADSTGDNATLARRVIALAQSREPTLGLGRLICVDGLAGSGKTTFAEDLGGLARAPIVHLDDMYPGWHGLEAVGAEVEPMLRELAAGRTGRYRQWDWQHDRYGDEATVAPTPLLVLEGVGAGDRAWADLITILVWIDADRETRLRRGLDRDGPAEREHWLGWQADEQAMLARERTDVRADLSWRT